MKKIFILFITIGTIIVFGCKNRAHSQVPEAVKNTFKAKYPGEDDPDWHKDSNGNFESHFKIDGVKYRADFKPNGMWIETETNIDIDDLPKAIRKVVEEDYDGDISEIEKVDHHSKGAFYDVEFKRKGKNKDVEFKADGSILN